MNIDRYMVNLFFEIKRNVPLRLQENLKISHPEIGNLMIALYQACNDENIQHLTEIFLERAGEDWLEKLRTQSNATLKTRANDNILQNIDNDTDISKRTKPKRIYRGQVVID